MTLHENEATLGDVTLLDFDPQAWKGNNYPLRRGASYTW